MADNKKYYYLKLKADFFEGDSMIVLESMPDGYKYSNILLKLYLRSLKNEGKLMLNERIPYNATMLAQVTRHSVGDIEKAVRIFTDLGLIELLDNGAIYMSDIQNFVGKSSTEADRIRDYRKRIEGEKQVEIPESVTNVRTNVLANQRHLSDECSYKNTPEIEIELEKELEIKIEQETEKEAKSSGGGVHLFYQQNFGMPTAFIIQDLENWINDLSEDVVIMALQKAIEANAPYSYAKAIMKSWANKGIKTIEAAEAESVGNQKQKQNPWQQQPKKEITPAWTEQPRTETALDQEQQAAINARIARLQSSKREA
ncbi:replication initiation and membrane attachment [Trichococcus palustris]|uniref:Replication initiation and membrane attachment n=1 Tax=Trichococcus palustris TaxID=140314 RepID=A0A143YAN3_9LACT|nr:phage replisome organizer N-terminal domain-containing protein [Trichococcus palustris]CZQ83719.1 replication initiation and membrane attachment [Trichococcus palustris]SFK70438.1 phage replisome organizer, putative, N-terminal region [Trichococcus palustris]